MVGETGTSKTATALSTIQGMNPDTITSLTINFSSRTTSSDVLRMINANVEKRAKGVYGPMPGKKLIVFLDDLNMPQVKTHICTYKASFCSKSAMTIIVFILTQQEDAYGTQQPIALMRMILGRGGLFEQGKDLVWKSLKDMTYVGGMGPPGGGRRSLDPRFVSFFSVFHCLPPSTESLRKIFGGILHGHLTMGFSKKLLAMAPSITQMSIDCYMYVLQVTSIHDYVYDALCMI